MFLLLFAQLCQVGTTLSAKVTAQKAMKMPDFH